MSSRARLWVSLLGLLTLASACGGAPDGASDGTVDGPSEANAEQAISVAAAPRPFTLQFAGTYTGAAQGIITSLELRLDGSYALQRADGTHENGRFTGGTTKTTPLVIKLVAGAHHWNASVAGYDGKLVAAGQTLTLKRPARSDEDLCDSTGGAWTDDEQDPATGLFCVCQPARLFVPAAGGCVSRTAKH